MAIRAVTDTRGNTVTETVHERTRRSRIDHGGPAVAAAQSTELEQLKEENAELTRSLGLLRAPPPPFLPPHWTGVIRRSADPPDADPLTHRP